MSSFPHLAIIIVNITLGLAIVTGIFWTLLGVPLAIIDLIKNHKFSDSERKRWLWIRFGGLILLAIVLLLYSLIFWLRVTEPIGYI